MEKLIRFLKIDTTVQKILLFLTFCCIVMPMAIGLVLCILGAWQILSAIVVWLNLKDISRGRYLIFCIGYLAMMGGIIYSFDNPGDWFLWILGIVFIIIPILIAIWYLKLTNQTLKDLEKNKDHYFFVRNDSEDILDSNEFLYPLKNRIE